MPGVGGAMGRFFRAIRGFFGRLLTGVEQRNPEILLENAVQYELNNLKKLQVAAARTRRNPSRPGQCRRPPKAGRSLRQRRLRRLGRYFESRRAGRPRANKLEGSLGILRSEVR